MSKGWIYKSGDWNLLCDVCAVKTKASKTKERWDGLRVCPECFEVRHPMDFIKARADRISVPFTRPQPTDQFIAIALSQFLNDTVTISYGGDAGSYLEDNTTYFLENYLVLGPVNELQFTVSKPVTDTVAFSDAVSFEYPRDIVDATTNTDSIINLVGKSLVDSVTTSDNGSLFVHDYIDSTYFESMDYIGSVVGSF